MCNKPLLFIPISKTGLGLCCLLLVVFCAGCNGQPPESAAEPVTITFSYRQYDQDYYARLIESFQKENPHITIEAQPRQEEWTTTEDPSQADVFVATSYTVNALRDTERVFTLTPFLEGDPKFDEANYFAGSLALFRGEGQTWAIPAGADPVVMYYNKDLFDLYQASYPEPGWTWDDFLNIALTVTDPGKDIFGYGPIGYNPDTNFVDLLHFIYQHNGKIFDDLTEPATTTLDDPLTVEAVAWYVDLVNKHHVAPTPTEVRSFGPGGYGIYMGILSGKIAMWMGNFSEQGGQTWPEDAEWDDWAWGMVPLPQDAQAITSMTVEGYAISTQTDHANECWEWIAYLSQQMPPSRLVPVKPALLEAKEYRQRLGDDQVQVIQSAMKTAVLYPDVPEKFLRPIEAFIKAVNNLLKEEMTPEQAMQNAQKEAEKLLAQ